jgi:hypothetical protein
VKFWISQQHSTADESKHEDKEKSEAMNQKNEKI